MLSIDYFAEFQVEESYESFEESGGSDTAEPSSDSPDEKEAHEEKRSKRKHGEFEASDSLPLCKYEVERAAQIRHNEEMMQQLGIKSLPMPTPAKKETKRKRLTVVQSPRSAMLTRTAAAQLSKHLKST